MSDSNLARRTAVEVFFAGMDITSSLQKYFLSLTYTDNEEDETDDLQIKLQDRDGVWLEEWLNTAIQTAAENPETEVMKKYRIAASGGAVVHSSKDSGSKSIGTLAYGTVVSAESEDEGWVSIKYSDKTGYVREQHLQPVYLTKGEDADSPPEVFEEGEACKGLKIQASIIRQNWIVDGTDERMECGRFELDNVTAQGPPSVITVKGTSLPYGSTIRQTKKSKSWENYILSGIAKEIAVENGMACMFLADTDPEYKRVEQYRLSDIAFLQKLCRDAGFSLKVTNNIIVIFDQAAYENREPSGVIKRGSAGGYISYKLSTGKNDVYTSCRVSYVDADGVLITGTAYVDGYDEKSDKNQCLEIKQKVSSTAEAEALAQKHLRLNNKYEFSASFVFPGNPGYLAGCVYILEGWGAWDGRYIIKQAKHSVSKSGYTTEISLRRALKFDKADTSINSASKSVDELAREVIRGEWGNGEERKRRLAEAGYDYNTVQSRVNELLM